MKNYYKDWLTTGLVLAGGLGPLTAAAQGETPERQVYSVVEQMPELPSGYGQQVIVQAIQDKYRYPKLKTDRPPEGQIFLTFLVEPDGRLTSLQLLKGVSPAIDQEVLRAVRRLPRFIPGRQNGRPVTVRFIVPMRVVGGLLRAIPMREPPRRGGAAVGDQMPSKNSITMRGTTDDLASEGTDRPATEPDSSKVYTYVELMPSLPGRGGAWAITAAVEQALVLPPGTAQEGRVFASFTVRPSGLVADAKIVKGLTGRLDTVVLRAVSQLPRFVAGQQNGRRVAVSFTIPVTIRLPGHVYEATEAATPARFAAPGLPGLYDYLRRNLHVPPVALTEKLQGRVGVDFTVRANGQVDSPALTSHLCASCDAEVLRLVQSFPAWLPARSVGGQPLATHQHLEIPVPLPTAALPYAAAADKPQTYVQQPPALFDGTSGPAALGVALAQAIRYPEAVRRENISGPVRVEFVVDANGVVRRPRITLPLCASCDQSVLDALARLGPFVPGRQRDEAVSVLLQVPVSFSPVAGAAPVGK